MWILKNILQNCRKIEEAVIIPHDSTVSYKITKKSENIFKIHVFRTIDNIITTIRTVAVISRRYNAYIHDIFTI